MAEETPRDLDRAEPRTIGGAIETLLQSRRLSAAAPLSTLGAAWERIAGEELARHSWPVLLRGRELVCYADDPGWATKLRLGSGAVLRAAEKELGERVADRLVISVHRRP